MIGEKFENATITVHFDSCLGTVARKSHDCRHAIVFEKLRFQNVFRKAGVFKFLRFEQRLLKLPSRDGLVWIDKIRFY